jgi:arylsulfatase A-like enzyme
MRDDMDDIPEIGKQIAELPQMPTTEWMKKNQEWKKVVQAYLATISMVDHCVGTIVQALEESGHAENTVVILWSDHGYHLGEKNRVAKMSLWERSTRVPLVITAPGYKGGQSTEAPASLMDVYPTLLDLCGLPENTNNEGVSLVPLMKNPDVDWPHYAVITFGENNHSVRSKRYSYIRYEDGSEELYDNSIDPNQWKNLANNPEFIPIKAELKKSLPTVNAKWSKYTKNMSNSFFAKKTKDAQKRDTEN